MATRKEREAAATVLFHPDFDRRLRSCTESADPSFPVFPETEGARGLGLFTLTAGGDFHPALRTSAARNGQPAGNYGQSLRGRQGPLDGEPACPMCLPRIQDYPRTANLRQAKVNDWFTPAIRFRFVLKFIIVTQISCGRARLSLWTDSGAGCADSANHITSSRQALIGN
jgi:hypothetical protein